MATTNINSPKAPISLKDFFERIPPATRVDVVDVATPLDATALPSRYSRTRELKLPDLDLHCSECDGVRRFSTHSELVVGKGRLEELFATYFCRNCSACVKTYAVRANRHADEVVEMFKYGEDPSFGPPLPSKLIELIRPEWEYFKKGRRSENQGLGIGSFAYYRRVIDSQKNRILDEIIKAANKLGTAAETIQELEHAKLESQFTKAVDGVKHALPQALLIEGSNPLTLLYSALSVGLHARSDEECLAAATDVRLVMTALAERLVAVLTDDNELKNAVARLVKQNSST